MPTPSRRTRPTSLGTTPIPRTPCATTSPKIIGKHTLQFGAYGVIAQKNQENSPQIEGAIGFDASNGSVSTGNAFADLLLGNIASYSQTNNQIKYYDRYQLVEPYIQDDFHATSRLTLNIGLRMSFFGTYYEKFNREYNFNTSAWTHGKRASPRPEHRGAAQSQYRRAPFLLQPRRCAVPFQRHRAVRRTGPASRMPEVTLAESGAPHRIRLGSLGQRQDSRSRWLRRLFRPRKWQRGQRRDSGGQRSSGAHARPVQYYRDRPAGSPPATLAWATPAVLRWPSRSRSLPFRTNPFGRTRNSGI